VAFAPTVEDEVRETASVHGVKPIAVTMLYVVATVASVSFVLVTRHGYVAVNAMTFSVTESATYEPYALPGRGY
jgi:hypothetical protein